MTIVDLRVGLRARLLGDSAISTAVGGTRIYPMKLPQGNIQPSIVYSRISAVRDYHSLGPSGLVQGRVQVDCWAQTMDAADSLARLVLERLDGFSGSILWGDNSPEEAVVVQSIMFANRESDDYDDAAKLYRVSRDFFVWYEER